MKLSADDILRRIDAISNSQDQYRTLVFQMLNTITLKLTAMQHLTTVKLTYKTSKHRPVIKEGQNRTKFPVEVKQYSEFHMDTMISML